MTVIIAVLAFIAGFLTAWLAALKKSHKHDDVVDITARRRAKEYQNFLSYDGTAQEEIF